MFNKQNNPERVAIIVDYLNTIPNLTPEKVLQYLKKIWAKLRKHKLQPKELCFNQFRRHVWGKYVEAYNNFIFKELMQGRHPQ